MNGNPEGEICRKSAECGDPEEAFDARPEGGFTPDARDEASEGAAGFMASVLLGCLALLLPTLSSSRQSPLLFWMNMAVFPVGALAMARSTGRPRLGRPASLEAAGWFRERRCCSRTQGSISQIGGR